MLIGSYGHPVPALRLRFTGTGGVTVAEGRAAPKAGGRHEGTVTIPFIRSRRRGGGDAGRAGSGAGAGAAAGGGGRATGGAGAGAGAGEAGSFCLSLVRARGSFVLGGEGGGTAPRAARSWTAVQQPGRVSLLYARAGSESWWQLLPTLDERFGLGKASGFFGDWTLPFAGAPAARGLGRSSSGCCSAN